MIEALCVEQVDIYIRNLGAVDYRRGVSNIWDLDENHKDMKNEEKGSWDGGLGNL